MFVFGGFHRELFIIYYVFNITIIIIYLRFQLQRLHENDPNKNRFSSQTKGGKNCSKSDEKLLLTQRLVLVRPLSLCCSSEVSGAEVEERRGGAGEAAL